LNRRRLRTNNMLERLNNGIKRRTRVATPFPNEASCLRLVCTVAIEPGVNRIERIRKIAEGPLLYR